MACGVPCVATDVGDAALLVGEAGRIVPPRDPQALAEAWGKLLDAGPETRQRLGVAARDRIQACFSLPEITCRYERLYEEIAGRCAD